VPGNYGSNGLRTDGTSFNVGNKLGAKPSIRLFSQYSSGSAMDAILSQQDDVPESGLGRRSEPVPPTSAPWSAPGGGDKRHTQDPGTSNDEVEVAKRQNGDASADPSQPAPKAQPVESTYVPCRTKEDLQWVQQRLLQGITSNRVKDVRTAVEDGADICQCDDAGLTPLHVAASLGKARVVEVLLSLGADPRARTSDGQLPADMAKSDDLRNLLTGVLPDCTHPQPHVLV